MPIFLKFVKNSDFKKPQNLKIFKEKTGKIPVFL